MREFRFVLGRRALIVFLALLVATGAFLGMPAATQTLADSPAPVATSGSSTLVGTSDGYAITVTYPTAGATWAVGMDQNIIWTSVDISGTCTVDLSRSGAGGPWETRTTTTATQGTFTWTVTGLVTSTNCFIRVTNEKTTGTSGQFTIAASPTPAAMPGLSPWGLTLLSFALLGAGGWWFLHRRRLA